MAIPYESAFPVTMGVAKERYERPHGFALEAFELDLFGNWGYRRWGVDDKSTSHALRAERPRDLASAFRTVYRVYAATKNKTRYGEKSPSFVVHMDLLSRILPESRFIHLIRDGRDVALSYRDGGWGPKTIAEAALYWKRFVSVGRSSGERLGQGRYMEVHYENLVAEPEKNVRAVCSFVELDFDDSMLRYFERPDAVPGGLHPYLERGHQNLKRPPIKGIRDWRRQMTREEAAIFEVLAGDLLAELGYEASPFSPTPALRIRAAEGWLGMQARRARRKVHKSFARRQSQVRR